MNKYAEYAQVTLNAYRAEGATETEIAEYEQFFALPDREILILETEMVLDGIALNMFNVLGQWLKHYYQTQK